MNIDTSSHSRIYTYLHVLSDIFHSILLSFSSYKNTPIKTFEKYYILGAWKLFTVIKMRTRRGAKLTFRYMLLFKNQISI